MRAPDHVPIIPPFSAETKARLAQSLADLRRLKMDLDYAAAAGLPVQADLTTCVQSIERLQRLYSAYFSG